jgi:hypothetical protein
MTHDIDAMRAIYGELTGDYGASVATMTPALIALRTESAIGEEQCRAAAMFAKGKQRRQYTLWAKQHMANMLAIADALNPPAPDELGLSDAELIQQLYDDLSDFAPA